MTPPLILASKSAGRRALLTKVNLDFTCKPADIDEESIIAHGHANNVPIEAITSTLAEKKAHKISAEHPDALVIGSDQTLEHHGKLLSKATNAADAKEKLISLRGDTHILHSAVCVAYNGQTLFSDIDHATLTMHNFDDEFLHDYMNADPDALTSCVGAYKIEGIGGWLFKSIKGNSATIMGMPMLKLLQFLKEHYAFKP